MFYLVRNLKTSLLFQPNQMHRLGKQQAIIKRLKQKIEGYCHSEYGYIIQQIYDGSYGKTQKQQKANYRISMPEVVENGCRVFITFSAICFKAQKNDIFDFRVKQIGEEGIKGKVGKADILIPRSKMDGSCDYKKDENVFVGKIGGSEFRIDKGTKIRCKCFEASVQLQQMKIIATLPNILLKFIEN